MLSNRLRRWPNMKPAVDQLIVLTGQRIPISIETWNQRYVCSAVETAPDVIIWDFDKNFDRVLENTLKSILV